LRPKTLGTGDNYRVVEQHWGEYCIKEIDGENRMAGPGCPIEDQSGYAQFGMMKTRLEKKCFEVLGEHDEAEIYAWYRRHRVEDTDGAHLTRHVERATCCRRQSNSRRRCTGPAGSSRWRSRASSTASRRRALASCSTL
jgi:hypothetical protein